MKKFSMLLITAIILLQGCVFENGGISGTGGSDQNGGISGTGGPKLPPPESLGVIDLPDHEFSQKRLKGYKNTTHYDQANLAYQTMRNRVFDEMSTQSSLFSNVYKYESEKDNMDVYHWKFDDTGLSEIQSVDFQGKEISKQIEWLMKVIDFESKEDCLLEGLSALDNASGSWDVFKSKNDKRLQISWTKNSDSIEVSYLNVSGSEHNGDLVFLIVKGSDVELKYTDSSAAKIVQIKWNTMTSMGSIIDPDFVNGEEKFWDENLDNINDSDNF